MGLQTFIVNCYFTIIKREQKIWKWKTVRLNKGRSCFRILEDWRQDKLASDRGQRTVRSKQATTLSRPTTMGRRLLSAQQTRLAPELRSSYIPIRGGPHFNLSNKKEKLSTFMPRKHIGEQKYLYTHSQHGAGRVPGPDLTSWRGGNHSTTDYIRVLT
jgi:hypothetical protein